MSRPFCVCVPARNEASRIATLIDALAKQSVGGVIPLALCVNNSDDDTVGVAKSAATATAGRIDLAIVERRFDVPLAHAGSARRAAMDLGADLVGGVTGLLISTDADCRPPAEWIGAILAAGSGERIVGGRIALDEAEPVAAAIWAVRRRFDVYWRAVRAIEDVLDPRPWDPPPRHGDHTGASLALSRDLYGRSGGVPLLATGEDRALVDAAIGVGGQLVHPASVWTRVSARTAGRAIDGMATDMRRWADEDASRALAVPAYRHWRERAEWRSALRLRMTDGEIRRAEAALPPMPCDMELPSPEYVAA
jgi:glycosyltransferase involved in cell wall biosynthesis